GLERGCDAAEPGCVGERQILGEPDRDTGHERIAGPRRIDRDHALVWEPYLVGTEHEQVAISRGDTGRTGTTTTQLVRRRARGVDVRHAEVGDRLRLAFVRAQHVDAREQLVGERARWRGV